MIQSFLGYSLSFPGSSHVLLALSTFIYLYGGWPFLKGLGSEIKDRRPGMMTLIGLAVSTAYGYSALVVLGVPGKFFFWELVTLIDVMLLGHWIEMRSVMGASAALEKLAAMLPGEAHLIDSDGSIRDVSVESLERGNRILVRPGERVPLDGEITEGRSEVDQALVTGESSPVSKQPGDTVVGGVVNGTGALTVKISGGLEDSYVSRVTEMVREAAGSKSRAQGLADRAAFWLTVVAVSVGVLTLVGWLIQGREAVFALERMVTVMVITCPHALGLAIPLVLAVITSLSAGRGLVIRDRNAFEAARNLDVFVFDKTGTLTRGEFGVVEVLTYGDRAVEDVLRAAAAVEANSEHGIARAIFDEAEERGLNPAPASAFEALPGKGARGRFEGEMIYVGNLAVLDGLDVEDEKARQDARQSISTGRTAVVVAADDEIWGLVVLEDLIREESRSAVDYLKTEGKQVAMITGDNHPAAQRVAAELGIETFFAEVPPDKKSDRIVELQAEGLSVAMVGDGINDAPALARADLGVAIGSGTDIAAETAHVVLVGDDPRAVADIVGLSALARRKMIQNLIWATGYNVVAIPLAAGVWAGVGIVLPPAVGALVMSVSTVIVAINARLTSYRPRYR
jgi:Cu2+-exporting ATPase